MFRYFVYINLADPTTTGAYLNFSRELNFGEPVVDRVTLLPGGFILLVDEATSYPILRPNDLVGKVISVPDENDPKYIKELIAHLEENGWHQKYGIATLKNTGPS